MIEFNATSPSGTSGAEEAGETNVLYLNPAKAAFAELKQDPMAGWLNAALLPEELTKIKKTAENINHDSDYLVCIGIGGSYLGHKAVIDALEPESKTKILYAGNNLSTLELNKTLKTLENHSFSINVISKSGTTFEPSLAFEIFKEKLKEKYGEDLAKKRIYATTDAHRGKLHDEALENGYETFTVPDDVGGRYSVLTPVGLLPLAVAGVSIDSLLQGAKREKDELSYALATNSNDLKTLAPLTYATLRQKYHKSYHDVEILATFEPELQTFQEWWKQLFGESEGKNHQGIFPASVVYTTDLHSLGQYLQDGRRNILETFLKIKKSYDDFKGTRPDDQKPEPIKITKKHNLDYYNALAYKSTVEAHRSGNIPVFEVGFDQIDEQNLGALIYFFELACAISAKLQGVNPFDQPGVEAYKNNLKSML